MVDNCSMFDVRCSMFDVRCLMFDVTGFRYYSIIFCLLNR